MRKDTSFVKDLKDGQQAEIEAAELLQSLYPDKWIECIFNESKDLTQLRKHDFELVKPDGTKNSFEVKYDKRSSSTGNIALEIENSGKPSGIFGTSADFFVIKTGDDFLLFDTEQLQEYVRNNNLKEVNVFHNRTRVALVKKEVLLKELEHRLYTHKHDDNEDNKDAATGAE